MILWLNMLVFGLMLIMFKFDEFLILESYWNSWLMINVCVCFDDWVLDEFLMSSLWVLDEFFMSSLWVLYDLYEFFMISWWVLYVSWWFN